MLPLLVIQTLPVVDFPSSFPTWVLMGAANSPISPLAKRYVNPDTTFAPLERPFRMRPVGAVMKA